MSIFLKVSFFIVMVFGVFTFSDSKYNLSYVNAETFPSYEDGLKKAEFGNDSAPTTNKIVTKIIIFVLNFIGALAVVYLIIGGIFYLTSGGDENRTSMAKTIIMRAILGLVIVLLAWVIVNLISKAITK